MRGSHYRRHDSFLRMICFIDSAYSEATLRNRFQWYWLYNLQLRVAQNILSSAATVIDEIEVRLESGVGARFGALANLGRGITETTTSASLRRQLSPVFHDHAIRRHLI